MICYFVIFYPIMKLFKKSPKKTRKNNVLGNLSFINGQSKKSIIDPCPRIAPGLTFLTFLPQIDLTTKPNRNIYI